MLFILLLFAQGFPGLGLSQRGLVSAFELVPTSWQRLTMLGRLLLRIYLVFMTLKKPGRCLPLSFLRLSSLCHLESPAKYSHFISYRFSLSLSSPPSFFQGIETNLDSHHLLSTPCDSTKARQASELWCLPTRLRSGLFQLKVPLRMCEGPLGSCLGFWCLYGIDDCRITCLRYLRGLGPLNVRF